MEELKFIPPYTGPMDQFPASPEYPEGVISVNWTDEAMPMVDFHLDVVYDERDGEKLTLQILLPLTGMFAFGQPPKKHPLIVYVPGSAWRRQMTKMSVSRMISYCARGYAVAIVQYRPSDVAPFPAQIEDTKTAIRFMRKNADEYRIDPNKVIVYGDSSGGHTSAAVGITGNGVLDNGVYGEFSAEVQGIVDSFGPTDVSKMNFYPSMLDHVSEQSPEGMLLGGVNVLENTDLAEKASPMYYLYKEKATPPMLIMHGSKDQMVPFNQSVRLYEKMKELGKDVVMYRLENASHGMGGFNSKDAVDTFIDFAEKCFA